MSKRKVTYLNPVTNNIEELLMTLDELKPHIKSIAIAAFLDKTDEYNIDRITWLVSIDDIAEVVGLLEALKIRIFQEHDIIG